MRIWGILSACETESWSASLAGGLHEKRLIVEEEVVQCFDSFSSALVSDTYDL